MTSTFETVDFTGPKAVDFRLVHALVPLVVEDLSCGRPTTRPRFWCQQELAAGL